MAVTDVDSDAANLDIDPLDEIRIAGRVRIAENGTRRSDRFELAKDLAPTDVPGVQNELDARESPVDVRSELAVGIRDQSDEVDV